MARFQAPKLLGLIALGFMVVALPLVVAIVTAIDQVDRLAVESREALTSVQQNTSISRTLADRVRELERTARQYQALADVEYKALYDQHRSAVLELFELLEVRNDQGDLSDLLDRAREAEERANATFIATSAGDDASTLEAAFARLNEDTLAVMRELDSQAKVLRNALPERASGVQDVLVAQAALVIPLSIALALLFGSLVSRSFGQIDRSIRLLGEGRLREPVLVRGTKDLEELGEKLEWLRTRLLDLESQKAEFLRNVSHELKTPLTNVREAAELLSDEVRTPDAGEETAAIVAILRSNSLRLQQMIEELLRYGAVSVRQSEAGETIRLDTLVSSVVDRFGAAPAARAVKIRTNLTPLEVEGDPNRLRAIVDNLLSNAVRYSPPEGEVEVRLCARNGTVTLDVKDEGPGIGEDDVPHVFDWFFTGRQPENATIPGTGMGLAIAREYAEMQGGGLMLLPSCKGAHFRLMLKEKSDDAD